MKLESLNFSPSTVNSWCKALGIMKYRRYIKPKLMLRNYISRLEWVLDDLEKDEERAQWSRGLRCGRVGGGRRPPETRRAKGGGGNPRRPRAPPPPPTKN